MVQAAPEQGPPSHTLSRYYITVSDGIGQRYLFITLANDTDLANMELQPGRRFVPDDMNPIFDRQLVAAIVGGEYPPGLGEQHMEGNAVMLQGMKRRVGSGEFRIDAVRRVGIYS